MAAARKAHKTTSTKSITKAQKSSTARKKATSSAKKKKTSAAKKTTAVKKTVARKSGSRKPGRNSVDGILEKYAKQRAEQQQKLTAVRKKIEQLESQTKAFQIETVSLKEAEASAETIIGTLDVDRDQAVRGLLNELGVKLIDEPEPGKKSAKKTKRSNARKTKKKTTKAKSRNKARGEKSASTKTPTAIEMTPLFDAVPTPPTSNGTVPTTAQSHESHGVTSDDSGDDSSGDDRSQAGK